MSSPEIEPTLEQVNSACMSYRHDFGLLKGAERWQLQAEARQWMIAWRKEFCVAQQHDDDFHPGQCLPDCMMPDGAECCPGYVKLYDAYWRLLKGRPAQPVASTDTTPRCEICDWPLAESEEKGCVPGNCSYRPQDPVEQARIRKRRDDVASRDRAEK
jgi:hypothetical protein